MFVEFWGAFTPVINSVHTSIHTFLAWGHVRHSAYPTHRGQGWVWTCFSRMQAGFLPLFLFTFTPHFYSHSHLSALNTCPSHNGPSQRSQRSHRCRALCCASRLPNSVATSQPAAAGCVQRHSIGDPRVTCSSVRVSTSLTVDHRINQPCFSPR
jgi:hypothetical protein